jgi:CxxC motif-containing protein (DUF1111 family)
MFRALLLAFAVILAGAFSLAMFEGSAPLGAAGMREELLATPLTPDLGGETTRVIDTDQAYTFLATNAPAERARQFAFGNRIFNTKWAQYPASVQAFDGLGPVFNRNSCSGCHVRDGRGEPPEHPGDPMESMLVRLSLAGSNSPHPNYGDQLNDRAILGVQPEGHAIIDYTEVEGAYGEGTKYTLLQPKIRFADLAFGSLSGALTRTTPTVTASRDG